MILGLISSQKEIFQFSVKLLAGIVLVYKFMEAVESFVARFEVDRGNASTVQSVLFNCFYEDAPLTSGDDPEERVKNFFAKIDADIFELSSQYSCKRDEIVQVYLKTTFHRT